MIATKATLKKRGFDNPKRLQLACVACGRKKMA